MKLAILHDSPVRLTSYMEELEDFKKVDNAIKNLPEFKDRDIQEIWVSTPYGAGRAAILWAVRHGIVVKWNRTKEELLTGADTALWFD